MNTAPDAISIGEPDARRARFRYATVSLRTPPTGDVTVAVAIQDTSVATVTPTSLIFTTSNYNRSQRVTVTSVDDDVVTGDRTTTITYTASGGGYDGVSASASVTVQDGDVKTLALSKGSLYGGEGRTLTYTAWLRTHPTGTVRVGVASQDTSVATVTPTSLIFTPSNWNTPQTLTLVLVDNDVDDPAERCTRIGYTFSGADYDGVSRAAFPRVCVADNDEKGLRVLTSSMVVGEGRTRQQTVWLKSEPTGDVTVRVESRGADVVTVSPTELTFTPLNWSTPQAVAFTGFDDDVYNGGNLPRRTTVEYTARGADYDGVTYTPTRVTLADDEPRPIRVPEGRSFSYRLSLTMYQGSPPIVVSPTSSDPDVLTVAPETLTWTVATSRQAQVVTVTVHDNEALGNGLATISHPTNPTPDWLPPIRGFIVTVVDDDTGGVTVTPTALTIAEGESASYTVVLTARPSADVTVSAASDDTGAATVDLSSLTFTPSNWDRAQTVTVTARLNGSATISHAASGGGYDDVPVDDVTVTVNTRSPDGPVLTNVRADPNPITVGEKSTLRWTPREDVEAVVVSAGDEELATVFTATATSYEVWPPETTTYTLSAQDSEGAPLGDFPVTVTVVHPPDGPVLTVWADPNPIMVGEQSTLRWTPREDVESVVVRVGDEELATVFTATATLYEVWPTETTTYYTLSAQDSEGAPLGDFPVTVTVLPRPPTNGTPTVSASCDPCEVAPGGAVKLSATASDPDGDPLTYAWSAPEGSFAGAADGATARWTAPARTGRVTIRVQVSDGRGGTASADVAVEVADRPPAFKQSVYRFELPENLDGGRRPVELGRVVAEDPEGDALTYELVSGDGGRFAIRARDGVVTYVGPGEDFETEPNRYDLVVRARDAFGAEARARVVVTVTDVNDAPEAVDDEAETPEDETVTVDVLANDTDADGDRLRVETVSAAAHGTAAVAGGAVTYAPAANYHGADRFTYVVSDGRGGTATATVDVTVLPVNDAPEAVDDEAETPEDETVTVDVLANDTDADGDRLRVETVSAAAHGTAAVAGGAVTYAPAANYHGADRFTYVVSDGRGGTATATVDVTVLPVNDAPEAVDDEAETPEDETVTVDVLANDTDADGDRLRVETVSAAAHGTAAVAGGAVTYAPAANYHGADRFTYVVSDEGGLTDTATVDVTVLPVNDAPEAVDDEAETPEDETVTVDVLANDTDADGDRLRVETVSAAAHGTAAVAGGAVTYAPAANYHGADRFTYVVSDEGGLTDTATVDVTVLPVNDAPEAVDDEAETPEDETVTVDVLANDTDADGDRLRVETVSAAAHGTAAVAGGAVTYAPAANYHGADRFTYVVSDEGGLTDTATVEVTVLPVNDAPVAVGVIPDQLLDEGGGEATVDLTPFFDDPDGDALTFRATSSDTDIATVTVAGAVLTLTPVAPGAVSVAVTAEDPGGLTATHTFAAGVGDRLARAVLGNTLAAVARSHLASARMTLGRRVTADPGEGSRLTVHGRSVPLGTAAARDAVGRMAMNWLSGFERRAERFSNVPPGLAAAPGGGPGLPALNGLSAGTLPGLGGLGRGGPDMLRGTDFLLAWGGGGGRDEARRGRRWRLWGQGDIQTFEGAPSAASDYDGDLRTAYLGLDTRPTDRWLAGLALARSRGAGDWRAGTARGRLTTTLTAVHPYAHWSDGATAVWAMIGGGRGTAENARDATGGVETSALGLRMGLVEARRRIGAAGGGVQFAVRGDAAWARLATGRGEQTVDAQRAAVNQMRLGADVSRPFRMANGLALAPFAEAHVRRDGGAGQNGTGLEFAGGLRAVRGMVRVDARARLLALHSATGYRERGAGVSLSVGGQGREGLSLSLAPRWGDRANGTGALWRDHVYRQHMPRASGDEWAVDASGGFGMKLRGGRLLTWFGEYSRSRHGRWIVGVRLGQ